MRYEDDRTYSKISANGSKSRETKKSSLGNFKSQNLKDYSSFQSNDSSYNLVKIADQTHSYQDGQDAFYERRADLDSSHLTNPNEILPDSAFDSFKLHHTHNSAGKPFESTAFPTAPGTGTPTHASLLAAQTATQPFFFGDYQPPLNLVLKPSKKQEEQEQIRDSSGKMRQTSQATLSQIKRKEAKNAFKNNKDIFLLPSTQKVYRGTRRLAFSRRMGMMDRPVIVMSFDGLIGDFYKRSFWADEGMSFISRARALKGLRLFYQYF